MMNPPPSHIYDFDKHSSVGPGTVSEEISAKVILATAGQGVVILESEEIEKNKRTSPLDIPNDIIIHILQLSGQDIVLCCSRSKHTSNKTPITIVASQVCNRWRSIVQNTPMLWTTFTLEIDVNCCMGCSVSNLLETRVQRFVQRFVERSGECLLDITVQVYGSVDDSRHPTGILELLTRQAHRRWRTLTFLGDYQPNVEVLEMFKFPKLRELHYEVSNPYEVWKYGHYSQAYNCFLANSIQLSSIKANFMPSIESPSLLKKIHSLQFGVCDEKSMYVLVELAKFLQDCSSVKDFKISSLDGSDMLKRGIIWRSPYITSFTMTGESTIEGQTLLEAALSLFNFPSLNDLVLECCEDWPTEVFKSFVKTSSGSITTLVLGEVLLSDEDLIRTLEVVPGLLSLRIYPFLPPEYFYAQSDSPATSYLWQRLTISLQNDPIVPKLQSLEISSDMGNVFDDDAAVSMVQSRWVCPASRSLEWSEAKGIRSFILKFLCRKIDSAVSARYEPLMFLEEEGLRVVVSGMDGCCVAGISKKIF